MATVLYRTCTDNYNYPTYGETPDKAVGVLDGCSINCLPMHVFWKNLILAECIGV